MLLEHSASCSLTESGRQPQQQQASSLTDCWTQVQCWRPFPRPRTKPCCHKSWGAKARPMVQLACVSAVQWAARSYSKISIETAAASSHQDSMLAHPHRLKHGSTCCPASFLCMAQMVSI